MKTVVAAAGSSLIGIAPKEQPTEKTIRLAKAAASLLDEAEHVVFCHGGSSQAERIRSVLADGARANISPNPPMDTCIAMSAGFLGFNLEDMISEQIARLKKDDALPTCAVLTQIIPNGADLPQIIEIDAIRTLLNSCRFLIAGGSGGIPVRRTQDGTFEGIETMADDSLTAAALADETNADCLLILLDDAEQLPAGPMDAEQAGSAGASERLSSEVRSALLAAARYAGAAPGRRAVLSHVPDALSALQGKTGLQIR